ncbi:unnamed protein product [Caenorhabditis angaria]|uniref:Uncharacterized protein n=1 Tax=Caenorhabditis angaria TaxID=860376 RepID=A0A9P1I8W0_9PELO|nr:unnamed protein product [Caenorhabditis angaria]
MRVVVSILLLILLHFVAADDKSECLSMCKDKFVGTAAEKSACEAGCEARKSIAKDIFGFSLCSADCVKMYSNETMVDEEEENDNGELKACKFACSLPYEASYTMTLDTSGPEPKWKIQQETSGSASSASIFDQNEDAFKTLSNILLKPRIFTPPSKSDNGLFLTSDDVKLDKSQQFLQTIVRRVMSDAQKQMEEMTGRPSGHGMIALKGPEVGNQGYDGRPIIRQFNIEEYEDYLQRNQQIHNQSIRWLILTMAILFLIISGLGIILFIRRPKIEHYTTVESSQFQHPPTFGQIPAKKSMISEDAESNWTQKEPEGEAPPAYDQVSVHKLP